MTNYYVKNGGKNSNTGLSDAQAWETIEQVNNFPFKTGDNVFFKCGGTWTGKQLRIDWGGNASNRVTIGAYHGSGTIGVDGNKPVIDGNNIVPIGDYTGLINVQKRDYVTVENIKVVNSAWDGVRFQGPSSNNNTTNIETGGIYKVGVKYQYVTTGVVEGCDITDASRTALYGGDWPAVLAITTCDSITIIKNIVHENYGEGIGIYKHSDNCIVEDNICYANAKAQIYIGLSRGNIVRRNLCYGTTDTTFWRGGSTGLGIGVSDEVWMSPYSENNKIYNNLVAYCSAGIFLWCGDYPDWPLKDTDVYNNIVIDCGTNLHLSSSRTAYINSAIKNNIFWSISGDSVQATVPSSHQGLTLDYNLWSKTPDTDAQGPNDPSYALPKLMKTSGWNNLIGGELIPEDFMLQPDSPAIDKGIPIDGMTHDFFGTSIPQGSAPDIGAIEYTDVFDPCEGVVCDNVCIGNDLWSRKCVDGSCIPDQLIESNSVTCGYDPCEGVVCDNVCIGNDLWSRKCVDGSCIPDQLIESNSVACGYDPCEGVVCDNVCIGNDLWSRKCVDGSCVPDQLIESNSVTCELCEGVVCGNICVGNDLWSQRCDPDTGTCVANQLLQLDSINCKIPDQVPSDESTIKTYIILGGFGLMGLAMLILRKK